jgi:hypothetical protein
MLTLLAFADRRNSTTLPRYIRFGVPLKPGSFFNNFGSRFMIFPQEMQNPPMGQMRQRGALAVQIVAPRSISAWFQW